MMLRWLALVVLVAAAAALRLAARLEDRRQAQLGQAGAALGLLLALGAVASDGVDVVDVYLVGALGALAMVSRDAYARGAAGVALVVLGLSLAAAGVGGVAPPAELAAGPAALLLTLAAGAGALAAAAFGRLLRAGLLPALLLAVGAIVVLTVHRPTDTHPDWWGVLAGLRQGHQAVFLFAPEALGQLGQPLVMGQGWAGLVALTGLLPLAAIVLVPKRGRVLCGVSALVVLAALGLLLTSGLALPIGDGAGGSLAEWTRAGLLEPRVTGPVYLDLVTVLPTVSAYALAIGLLVDRAWRGASVAPDVGPGGAADLDVGVAVGALILAALFGVYSEIGGARLDAGTAPLLIASALALLGLRFGLPGDRAGAWGAALLLLVGASQLPAGSLPGLL